MKCLLMAIVLLPVFAQAKTPKLNITLQHNSPAEQKRKEQIERLADKALYATVMENRPQMEKFLKRYSVKW